MALHYTTTRLLCQVGILRADLGWDGCGAVLLSCSPVIIVTAAHCVARSGHVTRDMRHVTPSRRRPEQIKVILGARDLSSAADSGGVILDVAEIITHPDFRP